MDVRELDARTCPEEDLLAMHEVEQACEAALAWGGPGRPAAEAVAFWRYPAATHESYHWLADGGFASLYVHGPTASFLQLLVRPQRRRSGIGSALLAAVVDRARLRDVQVVRGEHGTPEGAAFARRHGAVDGQRVVRSLLNLREAELREPLVPEGWRLETWFERVPDEHLDAYVRARLAMDDAPADEDFDFPSATAETVRASEASLRERDRQMRLTVALDESGEVGAFTELRLSRGSVVGFTDDTGTVAAHRGKGLAKAVKVESLRRLQADHPEVDAVTTMNAEENSVMRHINESVGFRPVATLTGASLRL